MPGNPAYLSGRKPPLPRDARSEANLRALETLGQLLQRCQTTARMIEVEDEESKRDLLDALSLADLSVMRLQVDENPDEIQI